MLVGLHSQQEGHPCHTSSSIQKEGGATPEGTSLPPLPASSCTRCSAIHTSNVGACCCIPAPAKQTSLFPKRLYMVQVAQTGGLMA